MDIKTATGYGILVRGDKLETLKDYIIELYKSGNHNDKIWFTVNKDELETVDAAEEMFYELLEADSTYRDYDGEIQILLATTDSYQVSYDFVGSFIPKSINHEEIPHILKELSEILNEPLNHHIIWSANN